MTSRHMGVLRRGVGALALVTLVGWGASSGAATVEAAPSAATAPHSIASPRPGTAVSVTGLSDGRIARDAQLRPRDFPRGWTSTSSSAPTTGTGCPSLDRAKAAASARANSRDFLAGTATAESAAYVYANTTTARHWFTQLSSRKTTACLVHALRASLGFEVATQGATLDSITSHVLAIEPVGDQHAAHILTVQLSAGQTRATAYADVIYVRVGRAVAAFSLGRVDRIFDPVLETRLARAVTGRLTSGLGGGPG